MGISRFVAMGVAAWVAGPLTAQVSPTFGERFQEFSRRTFSWQRMLIAGADTTIDQAIGQPDWWSRDAHGFAYRYSDRIGRRLVRNSTEMFASALLGEDNRFSQSSERRFFSRVRHVFAQTAGSADGSKKVLVSRLLATAAAVVASTAWRRRPIAGRDIVDGCAWGYVAHLENSFVAEFGPDLKAFGRRLAFKLFRGSQPRMQR